MTKKHKKTPWITNGILRSINSRNKLYKKLKKTKIDSLSYITKKTSFNRYRNTLNKTITKAKRVKNFALYSSPEVIVKSHNNTIISPNN